MVAPALLAGSGSSYAVVFESAAEAEAARARRLSLVFFHHPNYDAEVACIPTCADASHPPRYAAVKAGPYRSDKYKQAANVKPTAA